MCVNRHALHCYCLHLTWEINPITKIGKKNISFYCIFIKICSNEKVYPYDGRDFSLIQNENLNFSNTKMAAELISTRNA